VSRTITLTTRRRHIEIQPRQDHDRSRRRSGRAWRGARRQHGCRQRRDKQLVYAGVDDLDVVVIRNHCGQQRVCDHGRNSLAFGHA
jgi:hypothetical protein